MSDRAGELDDDIRRAPECDRVDRHRLDRAGAGDHFAAGMDTRTPRAGRIATNAGDRERVIAQIVIPAHLGN